MPNRVIREGYIESDRIDALSPDAERFYFRLMLKIDDFGCYTANRILLRASLFPLKDPAIISPAHLDRWLAECLRVDLVREYIVKGKPYLFVPRFNQRTRAMHRRFPAPPDEGDIPTIKPAGNQGVLPDLETPSNPHDCSPASGCQTYDGHMSVNMDNDSHSPKCQRNPIQSNPDGDGDGRVPPSVVNLIQNSDSVGVVAQKTSNTPTPAVSKAEKLKRQSLIGQAAEVLDFMNWKLGKHWQSRNGKGPSPIAELIMHRLKDGATVEQCKLVVLHRISVWFDDDKSREWLRPSTIFRPTKFPDYLGDIGKLSAAELERIRAANGFTPAITNGGPHAD